MTPRAPGRSAVLFIFITLLVDIIGLGMIVPVVPRLIMDLTGEGVSRAATYGGWLWFAYAVMQFLCAPILGNLSDRFGLRPVILYSLVALGGRTKGRWGGTRRPCPARSPAGVTSEARSFSPGTSRPRPAARSTQHADLERRLLQLAEQAHTRVRGV